MESLFTIYLTSEMTCKGLHFHIFAVEILNEVFMVISFLSPYYLGIFSCNSISQFLQIIF